MSQSQTIHRYEIPIDDQWHTIRLKGTIVHVDCRDTRGPIEIWAWAGGLIHYRMLRVYATGHEILLEEGQSVSHVGTALNPTGPGPFSPAYGRLVWHLVELVSAPPTAADPGGQP